MRGMKAFIIFFVVSFSGCIQSEYSFEDSKHDLLFDELAITWDEAIPLGNGFLGALVWQKDQRLRFSLDRSDLWDLRPKENLQNPELNFNWVYEKWKEDKYDEVQQMLDVPYDRDAAPSKIPAGALEFDISNFGEIKSVKLYVNTGICEVLWENDIRLLTFVQADRSVGWYRFEGLKERITTDLIEPAYNLSDDSGIDSPVSGQDLRRLGYPKGKLTSTEQSIDYNQEGWGGFHYQINVQWQYDKNILEGCWSISSHYPDLEKPELLPANTIVSRSLESGFENSLLNHQLWWKDYWAKSSISIPDSILEKQYYLEMYKFGSASRRETPPISLQAVWTADNGRLPPWKGDFHHDLNTQLSYWPSYTGNHLEEEMGFINWLWDHKSTFEEFTSRYFQTNGLNVPGVTTLEGKAMGGWIQYSLGPTVGAWLGQHFYLHWRYSMDRDFLENKAYPWIKSVAIYLDELAIKEDGIRKLPISSSPEIHDNSREAWFEETTNFDLALIKWTYSKASELANELDLTEDAYKWDSILIEWPSYSIDPEKGLNFAPGFSYDESHRHFSHLMAFHPLGLIDWSQGINEQEIISNTLSNLEKNGTDYWVGYSFSWLGNLYARAFEGKKATQALKTFATSFTLPNSFHVNGDQSGTGLSKFTYRPFTLEGNFAFASGIQEMLLQSHTGEIHIFPALPEEWRDVSFMNFRTEGAFLISASIQDKNFTHLKVYSENGGLLRLHNPFTTNNIEVSGIELSKDDLLDQIIEIGTEPGMTIHFNAINNE